MRRPVKPFVTEYKGPSRRQKDGVASAFGTEGETPWVESAERKAARPSEPKKVASKATPARRGDAPRDTGWANDMARFNGGANEESYEAAMRAADALFSGGSTRRRESAEPASTATGTAEARPQDQTASTAGSGRILRVIEEEPAPDLAALEAERMPKRRGRKPGSKNKPKIVASNGAEAPMEPTGAAKPDWRTLFDEMDEEETISAPVRPIAATRPIVIPTLRARGDDRFAWVRTKLGPGESWKRRLPKILW